VSAIASHAKRKVVTEPAAGTTRSVRTKIGSATKGKRAQRSRRAYPMAKTPTAAATAPVRAMKAPPSGSTSTLSPAKGTSHPMLARRGAPKTARSPTTTPSTPSVAVAVPDATGAPVWLRFTGL